MNPHLTIGSHAKMALGAALTTVSGLLMVLSLIVGWYSFPSPWNFVLGFAAGLFAGTGSALAIKGLVERRRERQK
jgi:hypothetical protein